MAQDRRASPDRTGKDANAQQVRDDIDAGRTRDKVDHPDPATAPLGTDAEAGGAPAPVQPRSTDRQPTQDETPASNRRFGAPRPETARPWLIAALVAIVVVAGLVWFFAAQ